MKIDIENKLFVLEFDKGYSGLGFEVCHQRATRLAKELKKTAPLPLDVTDVEKLHSLKLYYDSLCEVVRQRNLKTGWRSKSELTPQLIGLEGAVVQVIDSNDENRTFIVGKSTGFIPCHLELECYLADGGGSVYGAPFKSIKVIKH